VTFDNGPVNLLDPDTVDQPAALIVRIKKDPGLTVAVFRSEKPGYFMAHWDFLADNVRVAGMSGLCSERCFRPDTPGRDPAGWAL
jgi:enoyl-CoA hydratase/carnithine racemase